MKADRDLAQVIELILDKGLVINADITVSVGGTELLGVKVRAALASFQTAARYGLEFPAGTNFNAPGWKELNKEEARCPECGNKLQAEELLTSGCPICSWKRAGRKERELITATP